MHCLHSQPKWRQVINKIQYRELRKENDHWYIHTYHHESLWRGRGFHVSTSTRRRSSWQKNKNKNYYMNIKERKNFSMCECEQFLKLYLNNIHSYRYIYLYMYICIVCGASWQKKWQSDNSSDIIYPVYFRIWLCVIYVYIYRDSIRGTRREQWKWKKKKIQNNTTPAATKQ